MLLKTPPLSIPPYFSHYIVEVTGYFRSPFAAADAKHQRKTLLLERFSTGILTQRKQDALNHAKIYCFQVQGFDECKTNLKAWEYTDQRLEALQKKRKKPVKFIRAKQPTPKFTIPPTPNKQFLNLISTCKMKNEYLYVLIILEQSKPVRNPEYSAKDIDRWSSAPQKPKFITPSKPETILRAYERLLYVGGSVNVDLRIEQEIARIQKVHQAQVASKEIFTGEEAKSWARLLKNEDPKNIFCQNGKNWYENSNAIY